MRIHVNLIKALKMVKVIEQAMQNSGLHVHGLSGDDLAALTDHAIQEGQSIASGVKAFGLEAKAAASAPEVQ